MVRRIDRKETKDATETKSVVSYNLFLMMTNRSSTPSSLARLTIFSDFTCNRSWDF